LRRRTVLPRQPRRAAVRARRLAGRSARHSAASAAERLAADLLVLHDLRPAHHARLAAWPLHLRALGGAAGALPHVLHADAAGALRGADRAVPAPSRDRQDLSRRAVRVEPPGHPGSTAMTLSSRLKTGVAVAAIVAQLAALAGPAAAFCGFYVAKADSKLFNKSSKVVLARDG